MRVEEPANLLATLGLLSVRTGALTMVAPVLGPRGTPAPVRLALGLGLGLLALPLVTVPREILASESALALAVTTEALVGVCLGLHVVLLLEALSMAGQLADAQMGLGFAQLVSPEGDGSESILSHYGRAVAVPIFFALGGHIQLLQALAYSYRVVPPGGLPGWDAGLAQVIALGAGMFTLAFRMAAPVMAALFLADVALGLLGRAVSTLNIFVVGFSLKILVGLLVFAVTLEGAMLAFAGGTRGLLDSTLQLLK